MIGSKKMKIIDVPLRAKVFCHGDLIGTSRSVILNPLSYKVTHLVVSPDEDSNFEERLIPISWIGQCSASDIELSCSLNQFDLADHFTETKSASEMQHLLGYSSIGYPAWPGVPLLNIPLILNKRVPKGEIAVHHETEVDARDGSVGNLEELTVSIPTYHITQLILRNGLLWGRKAIAIPVEDIDQITEDGTVHLKLDRDEVNQFPTIEQHRLI
jgi:sporulation protein YlmC with PRC-barrel domain